MENYCFWHCSHKNRQNIITEQVDKMWPNYRPSINLRWWFRRGEGEVLRLLGYYRIVFVVKIYFHLYRSLMTWLLRSKTVGVLYCKYWISIQFLIGNVFDRCPRRWWSRTILRCPFTSWSRTQKKMFCVVNESALRHTVVTCSHVRLTLKIPKLTTNNED